MLKVIGHFFTNDKERYDELKEGLESLGYEIANEIGFNATIINNIPDEDEEA